MGFQEYEGPVRITFPAEGVMMVQPVDGPAGTFEDTPHPYRYGPGNRCTTCGLLPGADAHDPAKEESPDVV